MFGRPQNGNNVCKFFLQGRCRFGDGCKYEHPGSNQQQNGSNRFSALDNNDRNNRTSFSGRSDQYRSGSNQPLPYNITKEGIENDMKTEKPQWPFSAYGPGREAPKQLFGGFPIEQSFEEMRVMYYLAAASGNPQSAIRNEQELLTQANQQVQQVLSDLDGAVNYVIAGKDEHPNRIDMCVVPGGAQQQNAFATGQSQAAPSSNPSPFGAPPSSQPAFGAPSQPGGFGQPSAIGRSSAFGQPSTFGQRPAFGQPSAPASTFGQPSNPGGSGGFGQPSSLGQTSAFGQPSNPGQTSTFGQPSAPGQKGAFGQPSQLGNTNPSPFGQPSSTAQPSPFAQAGTASTFGQPSQPSPFGGIGSAQPSSGFGQASTFGQPATLNNAPQTSAFGQPSQPGNGAQTSTFGQPSPFAQPNQNQSSNPSPFATQAAQAPQQSAFGQPAQAQSGVFGRPSAPSPFGQPSQPATAPSPFGSVQPAQASTSSPFGQAPTTSPFAQPYTQPTTAAPASGPSPFAQAQTNGNSANHVTRNPDNSLRTWKNAPVTYIDAAPHIKLTTGGLARIFHPDGQPAANPDIEDPPDRYNAALEAAYRYVREQGAFEGGIMPEVPPRREWISWDV